MTINLITKKEYNELLEIQKNYPILTFYNRGYEYIDPKKLTEEDIKKKKEITEILKRAIVGFSEFNNFRMTEKVSGKIGTRLQYNYEADVENPKLSFIGVGYILLDELLNGFKIKEDES